MRQTTMCARLVSIVAVVWIGLVAGCSSSGTKPVTPGPGVPKPTRVSYEEIAERHNARVARQSRLWSRMAFAVRRPDPQNPNRTLSDQAEGHIQIEQPRRVSVSMTKLGELYFLLGSNESRYWWIDRSKSSEPVVLFGLHELATPESFEWLGVGVAPLELVDLFGITPMPEDVEEEVDVWVRAESDGRLSVIVPSRFGYRRMYFARESYELLNVELLDEVGEVLVSSELGRPRRVPVVGEGRPGEYMGTRIRLELPRDGINISIELAEQENRPLNEAAFDLPRLIRAYARNGILYDLDAQPQLAPEDGTETHDDSIEVLGANR